MKVFSHEDTKARRKKREQLTDLGSTVKGYGNEALVGYVKGPRGKHF